MLSHTEALPHRIVLRDDPDAPLWDENQMELRLTYAGPLMGASKGNNRVKHKHDIRCVFHRQLKTFWQNSRLLSTRAETVGVGKMQMYDEWLADKFSFGGFRFVPLVTEELALSCSLEILFLRPSAPGKLIKSGDIDNRLKTIFDALRRPGNNHEIPVGPDEPDELFYCLLEDDSLITHVSVETDQLLEAVGEGREVRDTDARLVITVRITPHRANLNNLDFIGN